MKGKSLTGHLSMLGAWALAFGCAVGSDAFVMPWTTFLPKAGPLGTIFGVFAGGLIMAVIAWNYHYMINRRPGPGGVYTYASEVFGHDHGFLCGYFLGFAYVAIVWLDVTAFVGVARYLLGDVFHFGFHYTIEGREIYLGHILLAIAAIAVASVLCCRRRLSGGVQTFMAVAFAAGILVCFVAALVCHEGGMEAVRPVFSPTGGGGFSQFLSILAIVPWLFVGFESISNSSSEFRFPLGKSFKVMLAALIASVIAYTLLTMLPVFASGGANGGWTGAIATIGGDPTFHAFDRASCAFGKFGKTILGLTLLGGIFTNLVGNTVAASRLTAAMASDGAFPSWFGDNCIDGVPRNAVLAIAGLSVLVMPLGSAVIVVVVDIAIVGAAIAYGYTSAAAFRMARTAGDRRTQVTGLLGTGISAAVVMLFLQPIFTLSSSVIATESYLVLVVWGLSGLALFLTVFHRDKLRRFGRSPVVWISLFVMILLLSLTWMYQTTQDTTEKAYEAVVRYHAEHCLHDGVSEQRHHHNYGNGDWRAALRKNLSVMNRTIIGNSFVQGGLNILALVLMIALYGILRRREHNMELEKVKAKSYFFSTVSHDIRTPLNAIIGFSELLQAGFKTEQERKQAIDSILVSGRTLLGLINDVLDLSKLESGKMEISPEPTDCARLLHAVLDAFRVSIRKTEVELRCQVGSMPLLMLDPQRLRQIVFNLVGNAVKFTSKGFIEVRASFDRSADGETGVCRIDVEDTGCGISDENLKYLGTAYVQVGEKRARNGGTGLGLAICRQLVRAMGGELKVSSTLGEGSTFSVVIPDVKVVSETAEANGTDETNATAGINGTNGMAGANGAGVPVPQAHPIRRILLVDDSKMNLLVLKALLNQLGNFEVATASNGQEALTILQAPGALPVDLVLTDMWMSELDGTGLVKAIRADPALAALRVIAVTADTEFQGKVEDLGFDGMLLKPVTLERLSNILGVME